VTALGTASRSSLSSPGERTLAPAEGWSTVLLLAALLAAVGFALDDARWVGTTPDGESQTWFVPAAILLGAAWGLVGAKARMPALVVHLIGAAIGSVVVIVLVAGVVSGAPDLLERLRGLNASLEAFAGDVFVRHLRSRETSVFLLVVGLVGWGTGAFAAFAVFRRRRPLSAILMAGLLLLANLSLTFQPQFVHLVVFAAASLLLLVRANLVEQRAGWVRRRIGDAGYVSGLFMRSGLTFVAVAMTGALALTASASSAPLAGAWRGLDDDLVRLGDQLNKIIGGVNAPARGPNALFSSEQTIRGLWVSSNEVVFRATTSDGLGHYWRAAVYDLFDGTTWHQSERFGVRVEAAQPLLGPTREIVPELGRHEVAATVTVVGSIGDIVLTPDAPYVLDRPAIVYGNAEGGPFAAAEFADGLRDGESYTVRALVRNEREADGGLTQARLTAASQAYPGWLARYAHIEEGSVGPMTYQTAERIVAALPADERDAFHVADAVQRFLFAGDFEYRTDVRGLCGGNQVVDCFLRTRAGYCEYFATTMVMLLRTQQIPARLAMGYLPGRKLADGAWEVDRGAAHAWVEVYFPGYGWVTFDPTPGNTENGQRPTSLEPGVAVPSPSPGGSPGGPGGRRTFEPDEPRDRPGASPGAGNLTPPPPGGAGGGLLAVLVTALLGLGLLVAALSVRERRRPTPEPDVVYRGVARLAGRFGYGPRPTQTAYEYATVLGEIVPAVREELALVARVKVEATYGRRQPGPDAIAALRAAYGRLRVRLLALAFRRRPRRR